MSSWQQTYAYSKEKAFHFGVDFSSSELSTAEWDTLRKQLMERVQTNKKLMSELTNLYEETRSNILANRSDEDEDNNNDVKNNLTTDRKMNNNLTEPEQNNLNHFKKIQSTERYKEFVKAHGYGYNYDPTLDYSHTHILNNLGPQLLAFRMDGYDINDHEWDALRTKVSARVNAELSDSISTLVSDIIQEELENHDIKQFNET